ncbi:MAG: DUF481 domain-containing protein [Phycisphaerales bacterium]|nr:DUF481 domain-containing protein [Phycisphaerales bacterium]
MPMHRFLLMTLLALLLAAVARADVVTLVNGDAIRGEVLASDGDAITLRHAVLGDLRIARASIVAMHAEPAAVTKAESTPSEPAPSGTANAAPAPAPTPTPTHAETQSAEGSQPDMHPTPTWKGGVDIGLAGASGNSETLNTRLALAIGRETAKMDTKFDATYARASENGRASKNRGEANANNDWKFGESPWGFFARGRFEFDEFTNYRLRLSGFVGPSYTLYRPEPLLLRFRAGLGGASEFKGPDPARGFRPEALAGFDTKWTISPRQSVFASFDYLPSLESATDFRLDLKAGYQFKVDPKSNMLLKAGVANRFTTRGDRTQRNDVDYFLTLGWEF